MKTIKLKILGTISVWTTFVMDYLDSISASEFIRKTAKVTFFGALSLAAVCAFYMALVVVACVV